MAGVGVAGARSCAVRCCGDTHAPLRLAHGELLTLGRTRATRITDPACSRRQVSLIADCNKCVVHLKQLGVNPSGLEGFAIKRDVTYDVGHGMRIEILLNKYPHIVEFDPPPESDPTEERNKRKLEDDDIADNAEKIPKLGSPPPVIESKPSTDSTWENIDNGDLYIYTSKGVKSSSKIAAYDMDGTIIKTRSGKVYPVDTKDWQIAYPEVHQKLRSYFSKGFKLVFLTNQAPIGKGRVKIDDFKKKLESIVQKLDVPIQAFIATGRGMYRKPMTGMWEVLVEEKNDNLQIDKEASFYCGDAAGRIANWAPGKKKDHSKADRLLAENVGLQFYTPEEHFLGHPQNRVPYEKPDFDPKELNYVPFNEKLINTQKEILVFVGFPGSGKSFLAKQIEDKSNKQYKSVCRDSLGAWQKCHSRATALIKEGKSVIIDSTNPDVESRARWTALAKELRVQCRCAKLNTSLSHSQHNNKFRELTKSKHAQVTDMVYHSYNKKFQEPSPSEGFSEVISVDMSPYFDSDQSEKLYKMHLLEK